jgi:hypothetical protein
LIVFVILALVLLVVTAAITKKPVTDEPAESQFLPRTVQGYIRTIEIDNGRISVQFDDIEFLGGEEAIAAAVADTGCARERIEECVGSLAGGFYIRNLVPDTERLAVSAEAEIVLLIGGSPDKKSSSPAELQAEFEAENSVLDSVPFTFHIEKGEIVRIEQMYVP